MPKFSRAHYEIIADIFSKVYSNTKIGPLGRLALDELYKELVERFKADNSRFRESSFEKRSYEYNRHKSSYYDLQDNDPASVAFGSVGQQI